MLCALFDKMAAQTVSDLESVIFTLPSLLCEMERHYLSDNIGMCVDFLQGEGKILWVYCECVHQCSLNRTTSQFP